MDIVDRIKSMAKANGVKLKYICAHLGVAESYFGNVKSGKNKISPERLIQIANILDTTPEYLRGETDKKEKPIAQDDELADALRTIESDPVRKKLFEQICTMDTDTLKRIDRFLDVLLDE